MARKRTNLAMSAAAAAQLKQQIRAATDPRDKERQLVVLWASGGQHTLDELARLAGRARDACAPQDGHDAVRAQLDRPDFFENLAGNHFRSKVKGSNRTLSPGVFPLA